jgi:hypothetical protein
MSRNVLRGLAALAFVGAIGVGTATPTLAQGVYVEGPGFDVGVGRPYYGYYHEPYAYGYHRYYRHRHYHDWDRW